MKTRVKRKPKPAPKKCLHNDPLCRRYGCPDDPTWKGDGCK